MEFMKERYGPAVIEELNEQRKSLRKVSDEEWRQMLKRYKAMI
jgi:hypothetical protein